jgi:cellulose synthase/poly-beta-1,6-N-acetylglucosamine synthase-like glycosyltransferase
MSNISRATDNRTHGMASTLKEGHLPIEAETSAPELTRDDKSKELTMLPTYVLITPARNEAQFIEQTIKSMLSQTVLPLKWVIVSDGSTDGTDEIVAKHAHRHSWIELLRMPERIERHFAGKVHAFNAGYAKVRDLNYEVIGNLDADITFDADYLAMLLSKFLQNPRLGVGGTPYEERKSQYDYRFASIEHVPGACQLFRRACFEEIGGYCPVKGGTVDTIAVMTAQMKGWETRVFTDKMCRHHRESGTAEGNSVSARFRRGAKAYALGNHPVWELFRAVYQMTRKPYIVGGSALLAGYVWSLIRRPPRPVSNELVVFHQREQMQRLRELLKGRWILGRKTYE